MKKQKYHLISIGSFLFVLLVWELCTDVLHLISPMMLPSPAKIFSTFVYKLKGGTNPDGATLFQNIWASLKIALGGYAVGVLIGVPLGIGMAWSRRFELFTKPLDYTAILASTDSNALGILRAADELGIRVPEQLSLMGFDNIASAAMPRIDLTTVEQSKREMALQAVEILLDKIERGTQGYVHQILMPSLVKRSSCRALT